MLKIHKGDIYIYIYIFTPGNYIYVCIIYIMIIDYYYYYSDPGMDEIPQREVTQIEKKREVPRLGEGDGEEAVRDTYEEIQKVVPEIQGSSRKRKG